MPSFPPLTLDGLREGALSGFVLLQIKNQNERVCGIYQHQPRATNRSLTHMHAYICAYVRDVAD